jgi:hypothetical protein
VRSVGSRPGEHDGPPGIGRAGYSARVGGWYTAAVGIYGVQFVSDGTAFILAGSYSTSNTFRVRLFITTASALSGGGYDFGAAALGAALVFGCAVVERPPRRLRRHPSEGGEF